ncbi:YqhR family membrane protein [Brevibacillus reuszeri]|uniref:YqhR family membrane protein n=1 Tax=Brevibacillus reuszeri TaxID=54915 RepID=UPI000CCC9D5E|nr:YqhR family membrane protein [Brevibacillus reuszeri]
MYVEATKTRGRHRENKAEQEGQQTSKQSSTSKVLEIAFWGTIIWSIVRLLAHFLNLTPYGLGAFARPLVGVDENSIAGIGLGAVILFIEALVATFLFSMLFSRQRVWWSGLLFGLVMLMIAGFFFRMGNWDFDTLSSEGAWYLSFGLFVGMTLTLEESDEIH